MGAATLMNIAQASKSESLGEDMKDKRSVSVFAPASIGNVSVGFDVLGLAVKYLIRRCRYCVECH